MGSSVYIPRTAKCLLVGPYDPDCGEYTFLAPPLGVWRLAGALQSQGVDAQVFDPNCCGPDVASAFEITLRSASWNLIGISTTAMTLRYDLALAHLARSLAPQAIIVAGGIEATFNPQRVFELGPPFDLIVLGEGEKPLIEIAKRLVHRADLAGIPGTALRTNDGGVARFHQIALTGEELSAAIHSTPYGQMPYGRYWEKLETAYEVRGLPYKAEREMRLAEIRSVRLITLNYCPMGCTFCSSTNYLHAAQGSTARVARLSAEGCLAMLERIVAAHPGVRTIIFQDDIFAFTQDQRILPLCEQIVAAKARGQLPERLQFISTNRIDAMTTERLTAMRRAGFRVLGFGIENFSGSVLEEFNKGRIKRHIEPVLSSALRLGITPFLDLILTSPRSTLCDLAENVRQAQHWIEAGCEVGIYPYVIPFSGAPIARDPSLEPYTEYEPTTVPGTSLAWRRATKILPADPRTRDAILAIEARFERASRSIAGRVRHLPSRARSVVWLLAAQRVLAEIGHPIGAPQGTAVSAPSNASLARRAAPARARSASKAVRLPRDFAMA